MNTIFKVTLKVPFNLSYWWNLGSLLGVLVIVQIITGLILRLYYDTSSEAFFTVWNIHLNVSNGYLIHIVHLNCSSFIFFFIYLHIFKGILFSAFLMQHLMWLSGCAIIVLIITISFLGYVLPWGQIRLWGATVITNLLTVIPVFGIEITQWVWRGFFVSNYTLKLFFRLHFLLPILLLALIFAHLFLLHYNGSSNPLGGQISVKTDFIPYYLYKDLINFTVVIVLFYLILTQPYLFADCENFMHSNSRASPLHIQPEWYFLNYYCILRAIPNKIGGVILFALSVVLIFLLCFKKNIYRWQRFKIWWTFCFVFLRINLLLIWLGSCPVEAPYLILSKILSTFYFIWFLIIFLL